MSLSADTLQLLLDAGLEGEALIAVVRSIEADTKSTRSPRSEANARYYAKNRDKRLNKTTEQDDLNPLPLSPSPQTPQPHTPAPVGLVTRTRKADPEFAEWYAGYPHKIGRGDAEKAWPKARAKASLAELIDGLDRYVRTKPPDRPWCNPATWLNQERWLDQPDEPQPPTGPHERHRQPTNNRAASRGDWSEILADRDGASARDFARTG